MPHISAKIFAGRSEEAKREFALAVRAAAVEHLGGEERYVTVSVEDVLPAEWYERVYLPEVSQNPHIVLIPQYTLTPDKLKN